MDSYLSTAGTEKEEATIEGDYKEEVDSWWIQQQ